MADYVIGPDGKYSDLPFTNLPSGVDTWEDSMDVDATSLAVVTLYKRYLAENNKEQANALKESNPNLKKMIMDASEINKLKHGLMALERMFVDDLDQYIKDQVFSDDLMIGTYVHTYNTSTKVHNFAGTGNNGRVKITAPYHNGDRFTINGVTANAYMGGVALTNLFNGQFMYFILDSGNKMYFIGGGDTSNLMPKSGGAFTGDITTKKITSDSVIQGNSIISQNSVTAQGALSVAGAASLSGATTVGGTFTVGTSANKKKSTLNGDAEVNGALTVTGNVSAARVYNAVYNDYAEFFQKGEETEPGDIIALDENSSIEQYIKATKDSKCIVGVHSNEYAHLIGGDNENIEDNMKRYIPVGLAGRVHVKITGEVHIGDYVEPSDFPGIGKATVDRTSRSIGYVVALDKPGFAKIKIIG